MADDQLKKESTLSHLLSRSGGASLINGNKVDYLRDAQENFPAWIEGLKSAREFICIEMYIFACNHFGKKIRSILLDKLRNNVRVYIIYDGFGSIFSEIKGFFNVLISEGAKVESYNKLRLISGLGILSRNHRKSIIIDGQLAFVSGLCISSKWEGNPQKGIPAWRDSGLRLKGPVVEHVLDAFKDSCKVVKMECSEIADWKDHILDQEIQVACRVVATNRSNTNMVRLDLTAISMANKSIWLTDAYFMPSKMYTQALINAAQDGVDVRILVPRTSDIKWIGMVSRTQYRSLLEAGVRIFEWNGSMIHAKSAIIDSVWARVGSTNLNFSSWFTNRELDIVLEGKDSVKPIIFSFLEDLKNTTEIVLNKNKLAEVSQKRNPLLPFERLQISHLQSKAIVRQFAHIGTTLDTVFRGGKEIVDRPELISFLVIGLFFLFITVVLIFIPKVILYPLILIMFTASWLSFFHSFKLWKKIRKKIKKKFINQNQKI